MILRSIKRSPANFSAVYLVKSGDDIDRIHCFQFMVMAYGLLYGFMAFEKTISITVIGFGFLFSGLKTPGLGGGGWLGYPNWKALWKVTSL